MQTTSGDAESAICAAFCALPGSLRNMRLTSWPLPVSIFVLRSLPDWFSMREQADINRIRGTRTRSTTVRVVAGSGPVVGKSFGLPGWRPF